jgi:hypothetical protein
MSTLIIPDGKKTGCQLRTTRPGQLCSLFAEKIPVIPVAQWGDLIGEVELRSCVTQVLDQDGVGSCATESTSQAVMIARKLEGQDFVLLNPWSIYATTSGGVDNGSSIDENLAFARDYGICPESVWPRSKGWRAKPHADAMAVAKEYRIGEFYDLGTTAEIGTALLLGFPVVFGWQGHSCVLTQLLTTTVAEYCNSWAPTWGDEGFGQIKLSSVNFGYGAWALRTAIINARTDV